MRIPADEPPPPPPPSPEELELEREMEYFVEPEEAFGRDRYVSVRGAGEWVWVVGRGFQTPPILKGDGQGAVALFVLLAVRSCLRGFLSASDAMSNSVRTELDCSRRSGAPGALR